MKEKPTYFAVIPADVRYAEISANSKLLYGEITALTSKEGFCWASNAYFAKLYGTTQKTVSRWIQELKNIGAIDYTVENRNTRKITILVDRGIPKNVHPVPQKCPGGDPQKCPHINTRYINTSNISAPQSGEGGEVNEIIDLFQEINPNTNQLFKRKHEREAVSRLLKKIGREKLEAAILAVKESNGMEYAPVITTPRELEERFGKLVAFWQKKRSKPIIGIAL